MQDNKNAILLVNELNKIYKNPDLSAKTRKFEVSAATSLLSDVYEKVRNTVDYKDEHLVRRFAVQRFLRIYLMSRSDPDELTELLIKDLLRGRYIQDSELTDKTVENISEIMAKYVESKAIYNEIRISRERAEVWDWLMGVAAAEIEKCIDPFYKPEIFVSMINDHILQALRHSSLDLSPEQEGLHVFIACHRALVRSDLSILRYHALKILYPDFFDFEKISEDSLNNLITNLNSIRSYIDGIIKSPIQEHLYLQIRRLAPPFKVLEGVVESNPTRIEQILLDPASLRDKTEEYITMFYSDLKKKLNLRMSRMLIYLFVTKMLLAILIEAPIDVYLYGHVNYFVLGVNTIFPVALFYYIARRIRMPGKENTDKIHSTLESVLYGNSLFLNLKEEQQFKKKLRLGVTEKGWLLYLYGILYLFVYGIIYLVLSRFGFNFISTLIFIFFVSVLSFFAWNVRARSMELQMVKRKETLFESLLNIIALPILKVGQKLSVEVARFNFFTVIFDFILEAPFKLIVQAFEDLIDFLKSKHEEVIQN